SAPDSASLRLQLLLSSEACLRRQETPSMVLRELLQNLAVSSTQDGGFSVSIFTGSAFLRSALQASERPSRWTFMQDSAASAPRERLSAQKVSTSPAQADACAAGAAAAGAAGTAGAAAADWAGAEAGLAAAAADAGAGAGAPLAAAVETATAALAGAVET